MGQKNGSRDPQIQVMIQEMHAILGHLKQEGKDITECSQWMEKIERISTHRRLISPYSTYDMIWQMLHKMRHALCRICSPGDLPAISVDIRGCLAYVAKEDRLRYEDDLDRTEESLKMHLSKQKSNRLLSMETIRYNLEYLSLVTADTRDLHWRKVNLLRTRLFATAVILGLLLMGCLEFVPQFLNIPNVTPIFILTIIGFGAIGGLVSAILSMESIEAPSSAYYIRRTLLLLKPVIGAATGLMIYLIQVSGIVTIATGQINSQAVYLVMAFLAGFSERFFVAKVEQLVGIEKKKEKIKPRQ